MIVEIRRVFATVKEDDFKEMQRQCREDKLDMGNAFAALVIMYGEGRIVIPEEYRHVKDRIDCVTHVQRGQDQRLLDTEDRR